MMTGDRAFVDTNVLLRAMTPQLPLHREAENLIQRYWDEGVELWISRQVIREYLVQVTHPNTFIVPLTSSQVVAQVDVICSLFRIADESHAVTTELLQLLQAYPTRGKQIHDANIVATLLAYGISTLLTQNLDDMRRFSDRVHLVQLSAEMS